MHPRARSTASKGRRSSLSAASSSRPPDDAQRVAEVVADHARELVEAVVLPSEFVATLLEFGVEVAGAGAE
ncbi:hypothetical protein BRC94_10860 [Halobacteriales archaeon QS_5_70_17]|nr:MAG: hypothetical protein BRC94_10860 [Halobacteriales archaeon QS_5_70_17]